MPHYLVYKTTHLPTGRFYVGRHVTEKLDDGYLGSGTILSNLLKAHDESEFSRETLHLASTGEEMLDMEDAVIAEVLNHPLCLNGIRGDPSKRGVICHSEASKARMSAARLGKPIHTPESKLKLSLAKLGKPIHTAESKRKLSDFRKTVKQTEEFKQRVREKMQGRRVSDEALQNMRASFTEDRREKISSKYSGAGNPRALAWTISFADGSPTITVTSLKTWCLEHGIKYTSLLATQRASQNHHYNNMRVQRG